MQTKLSLRRIWNFTTFSFISPYLLPKYNSKIRSLDDLPELLESDNLDYWVERFSSAFEDEEKNSIYRNKRFNIYKPLIWTLWKPFCGAIILRLCFDILALLSSVFPSFFLGSSSTEKTVISSIYIFLTVIGKSFFDCHSRLIMSRICIRIEGSLIWIALDRVVRHKEIYPELPLSTVYMIESSKKPSSCRKSLLLRQHEVKFCNSNAANQSSNIFNLIIGDASAIEIFFGVFVDFLLLPIRLILSWYVLSKVLGNSSALPSILTFCIILSASFLFEIIGVFNKEPFMINRDKRIDRCHEIISDIRSIRLTGLEDVAISRITKSREKELFWNKKRFIYSRIASFADYHLKVYSQYILFVLSLYYSFRQSDSNNNFIHTGASTLQILIELSSKIRGLPTNIIEGIISLQRYQSFIREHPIEKGSLSTNFRQNKSFDEVNKINFKDNNKNSNSEFNNCNSSLVSGHNRVKETLPLLERDILYIEKDSNNDPHYFNNGFLGRNDYSRNVIIYIKNGVFSWNNGVHKTTYNASTLKDINLTLKLKECIFLVGEPGCGKSSLIKAILNEIRPVSAEIYVQPEKMDGMISYSPQLPWIPSGSIRSAILFGREWNKEKYEMIVDCCQLKEDFSSWQHGDLRTVDEGGFSLSGGQRARVSLARALYSLPIRRSEGLKDNYFVDPDNMDKFESLLYLFDDVFVSVDPKVGYQIFNRLFGPNGLLLNVASIISISIDSLHHYMTNINRLYNRYSNSGIEKTSSYYEFNEFKFNVLVLNDGKIEWSGSYSDYSRQATNLSDLGILDDESDLNSMNHNRDFQINSFNYKDRSNCTKTQFEELLACSDGSCKNSKVIAKEETTFFSYKWYFKLLGPKWVAVFVLGCLGKVIIDKMLELLFVNRPEQMNQSTSSIYRLCFIATIAVLIESTISLVIYIGEAIGGVEAAKKSHEIFLDRILYAPFWFFDINSVGKILSRFSSDMLAIDNCTVRRITAVILPLIALVFNFSYVSFIVPFALPFEIVVIFFIVKYIGGKLILTYRDAQRCALLAQSPLCSIFSECLSGGTIIRAFKAESFYFNKCGRFVDKMARARFLQHSACQWAGFRMQLISAPLTLIVSLLGILFPNYKSTLALPLTYTINFAASVNDIIFRLISLEKDMCSVGRIYEYIRQLDEDNLNQTQIVLEDSAIPDTRQGILISDLEVRYRRPNYKLYDKKLKRSNSNNKDSINSITDFLDDMYFSPTLKNINEFAGPNDHIGIVGRTGSGKSTFIMALFGFVPTTKGYVHLDGIPINHLSTSAKRKVVGVLPQVPLILKGWTVRDFLDPERQRSSEDLWEALRICCLSSTIRSLPGGKMLDTVLVPDIEISSIGEDNIYSKLTKLKIGSNGSTSRNTENNITNLVAKYLSDSQLRYLSLARLVVNARDYRLILVDEPPPDTCEEQVTGRTYVPVHELLRTYFPHCTVFVVAHHAASLQNCNSIWILGNGTIEKVIHPKGTVSQQYLADLLRNH